VRFETVDERGYTDPRLASVYDALNQCGPSDDFYLDLVMSAGSALDLGCGTGLLLRTAAARGHQGRLVGVDPAAAMLAEARRDRADVTWIEGDARTVDLGARFELAIMANHVFQVLLTDDDVRAALDTVGRHLEHGGRFAFETRNPEVREWEAWTAEGAKRSARGPGGERVEVTYGLVRTDEPDVVELAATYDLDGSPKPYVSAETLRFADPAHVRSLLEASGFRVDGWFGDWDRSEFTRSSRELIVIAVRD
jgi:SAM-dependent methyltransferase